MSNRDQWTDADFDTMSWHDNYVHAFRMIEGAYGEGTLELDLDYIVEWLKGDDGRMLFRIAPATLSFRDVSNLKIGLDYQAMSAALGPFSIAGIERRMEAREHHVATNWTIEVNFPSGEMTFESSGFSQTLTGPATTKNQQYLTPAERQVRGPGPG